MRFMRYGITRLLCSLLMLGCLGFVLNGCGSGGPVDKTVLVGAYEGISTHPYRNLVIFSNGTYMCEACSSNSGWRSVVGTWEYYSNYGYIAFSSKDHGGKDQSLSGSYPVEKRKKSVLIETGDCKCWVKKDS